MGWGTSKGGSTGDGKHSGKRDLGKDKPSTDGARPKPGPKHQGKDKK